MQRIAYGLTNDIPRFHSQSPRQIGTHLRDLGIDGVFLKHLDRGWVDGLRAAGLAVYVSQPVFLALDDLWDRFLASRPILADGSPAPVQDWYRPALPISAALRAHRLQQLADLVRDLPVDGVWLDFIRWPARWEGAELSLYDSSFDAATVQQFALDTGISIPPAWSSAEAAVLLLGAQADAWFAWRCEQIAAFVTGARAIVRATRPDAIMGFFLVPWTGDAAHDHTGMDNAHIRIVGQDPTRLAPLVDVLSPMVYHRLCAQSPAWVGAVTRHVREQTAADVWPIIEALPDDPEYSAAEFGQAFANAADASTGGVIVFRLDGLLEDEEKSRIFCDDHA